MCGVLAVALASGTRRSTSPSPSTRWWQAGLCRSSTSPTPSQNYTNAENFLAAPSYSRKGERASRWSRPWTDVPGWINPTSPPPLDFATQESQPVPMVCGRGFPLSLLSPQRTGRSRRRQSFVQQWRQLHNPTEQVDQPCGSRVPLCRCRTKPESGPRDAE